jgi:hypothetical protein
MSTYSPPSDLGVSKETQHSSLWMRLPGSGMRTLWRCERRRSMAAGGAGRRRRRRSAAAALIILMKMHMTLLKNSHVGVAIIVKALQDAVFFQTEDQRERCTFPI